MPRYLLKQRRRWYAVMEIPKAVQSKFGKSRFKQTLETESLTLAEKRVRPIIVEWRSAVDLALAGGTTDKVADMLGHVAQARRDGYTEDDIADMAIDALTVNDGWGPSKFPSEENAELYRVATSMVWPLKPYIEQWKRTLDQEPKTIDMKVSDVKEFVRRFPNAQDASNDTVIDWVEELLLSDGLSKGTVRRKISASKGFWAWLNKKKKMDIPHPFADVVEPKSKKPTKAEIASRRKNFAASEYQQLLKASSKDIDLQNLIKLGAHTGARIEELCSLELSKVTSDRFVVEDAKSEAGWREIPIHKDIVKLVKELQQSSLDGYLLSGLSKNKYGDRSNAIGKRFGRLKSLCGFGRDYVFHSLRKSFARQLEEAGVSENIAARLIGHEMKTMTYGLYSGGADFSAKKLAIDKVTYKT
jgi:integrase